MIDALMYGFTPNAMMEKFCRPPPEKRLSSLQEAVLADDAFQLIPVDAGHGHVRQHPHDDEHPQDEEDAPADVRRAERVDESFEHGLLGRRFFCGGVGLGLGCLGCLSGHPGGSLFGGYLGGHCGS